jgi:quercetin dioxygenase-like cupin family protein
MFKVDFAALPWIEARAGVRIKTHRSGDRQVRLVEFSTSEGAPEWCESGHIGYVLAGALTIDFKGTVQEFRAGDGMVIPSGAASAHRGVWIEPGTQLLMIDGVT